MFRPIEFNQETGFYGAFETSPDSFLELWSTPEQREFNASHTRCSECDGWGYLKYRSRGQVVRENCGCPVCLGTGTVPRE